MVKKTSETRKYITEYDETIVIVESIKVSHSDSKESIYEIETDKIRTLKIPESELSPEIKKVESGDKLKYLTHAALRYYVKEIYDMKGNLLYSD